MRKSWRTLCCLLFIATACTKDIEPANVPPVVNAGPDATYTLTNFTDNITLAGSATDADGTVSGYIWTQVSGPNKASINDAGGATTTVNGLVSGTYTFQLMATDDDGAVGVKKVTITIVQKGIAPAENKAPVVNAGNDTTITLQAITDNILLRGSAKDDDGTVSGYAWTETSGPNQANIVSSGAATTSVNGLVTGKYEFQLMATDNKGATGIDKLVVNIIQNGAAAADNKLPVVTAGNDTTWKISGSIGSLQLKGSASDPDGSITSYVWSQIAGPNAATIINPGAPATPVANVVAGTYTFQLVVTDNRGATASKTVTINVSVNSTPVTVTLQPYNNSDVHLAIIGSSQDGSDESGPDIGATAWTVNGVPSITRGIIRFDLGSVPANATITSATLFLYSDPTPKNGNLTDANYGSNNSIVIQRAIAPWDPTTVTFQNQPSTETAGQVFVAHSSASREDLAINVTQMVQSMVNNGNYGFLFRLQNEQYYTSRLFGSSRHPDATKHPKLVFTYQAN